MLGAVNTANEGEPSTPSVALNLLDLKAFGERIAARDPDRQTARPPKSR
jgi:hypothetical protein